MAGNSQSSAQSPNREAIVTAEASWTVIAAFALVTAATLVLLPLLRESSMGSVLNGPPWYENLILFVALLLITVVAILGRWAKLGAASLGLRRDKLAQGLSTVVLVWLGMQAWPFVASGSGEIANTWRDPGVWPTLRWAAVMILATALWEEVAFRGFLLPQLYLKLKGRRWLRIAMALALSQLVFAIAHAPAHIAIRNLWGAELAQMLLLQGIAGLMLGLLYLRTRNLWIVIGIHGLANAPTPLIGGAMGWEIPLLLLLVAWPWLARDRGARGLADIRPSDRPAGDPLSGGAHRHEGA